MLAEAGPQPTARVNFAIPDAARPSPPGHDAVTHVGAPPQAPRAPDAMFGLDVSTEPRRRPPPRPRPNPPTAPAATQPNEADQAQVTTLPPTPVTSPSPETTRERPVGVVEIHARPAAMWRRLGAWAVDLALVGTVVALYLFVASLLVGQKPAAEHATRLDAMMARLHALEGALVPGILLAAVLALTYTAVFAFVWQGRTVGRRLLGLRLVDDTGLPPTPGRAVVRAVLSAVSVGLFFGGFWLALFDRKGQTLHDKLTRTFVVRPV